MKEDILQKQWLNYIGWWKENVRDEAHPPNEDGFWVWYAMKKMAEPPIPESSQER